MSSYSAIYLLFCTAFSSKNCLCSVGLQIGNADISVGKQRFSFVVMRVLVEILDSFSSFLFFHSTDRKQH